MGVWAKDGLIFDDGTAELDGYTDARAILSEDLQYRYSLLRVWDEKRPRMVCVMLNPSTASGRQDDATISKVVRFAKVYGMGELLVLNLYAYRATDPRELFAVSMAERVGPRNDEFLRTEMAAVARDGGLVVVGWGTKAEPEREARFKELSLGQWCWAINKGGSPKHPLYVAGATALSPWPAAE